jgi:hypothetical protein
MPEFTIPLTKGQYAVIDAADLPLVQAFKWTAQKDSSGSGNRFYAITHTKGGRKSPKKRIHMHRLIMDAPDHMEVDHVDRNGLNNSRSNLRIATHSQNAMNSGLQQNNTSGFKGVRFCKRRGNWEANIRVRGTRKYLGSFDNPEEAAHAYDRAAFEHHGEFAWLNFPNEVPQ